MIYSMRLSLMKGAHADLSSTASQEIGVKPYFGLSGIAALVVLPSRLPTTNAATRSPTAGRCCRGTPPIESSIGPLFSRCPGHGSQLRARSAEVTCSSERGFSVTGPVPCRVGEFTDNRLFRPTGAAILPQWVRAPGIWSQERAFRCSLFACCRLL
jgi:hypothetical protein